jgi:ATP-dependent DNA helicase RecG
MEKRETETLEFKKSTSELKEGVISLGSMLNKHNYGLLYFGIKNDGKVVGQMIGTSTTSDISKAIKDNLKPRITPSIEIVQEEGSMLSGLKSVGKIHRILLTGDTIFAPMMKTY